MELNDGINNRTNLHAKEDLVLSLKHGENGNEIRFSLSFWFFIYYFFLKK